MLKALLSAITGIDESLDDDDYQDSWQRQKYLDENDLDTNDRHKNFEAYWENLCSQCDPEAVELGKGISDLINDDQLEEPKKGWFGLW